MNIRINGDPTNHLMKVKCVVKGRDYDVDENGEFIMSSSDSLTITRRISGFGSSYKEICDDMVKETIHHFRTIYGYEGIVVLVEIQH